MNLALYLSRVRSSELLDRTSLLEAMTSSSSFAHPLRNKCALWTMVRHQLLDGVGYFTKVPLLCDLNPEMLCSGIDLLHVQDGFGAKRYTKSLAEVAQPMHEIGRRGLS